jgi:hypothetical protein
VRYSRTKEGGGETPQLYEDEVSLYFSERGYNITRYEFGGEGEGDNRQLIIEAEPINKEQIEDRCY